MIYRYSVGCAQRQPRPRAASQFRFDGGCKYVLHLDAVQFHGVLHARELLQVLSGDLFSLLKHLERLNKGATRTCEGKRGLDE